MPIQKYKKHFSLALRASFLIEFLAIVFDVKKVSHSVFILSKKTCILMSITIHISFKVTQILTT